MLNELKEVTARFNGFDLQKRRDWPQQWRARIVTNKNERADYRLTAWGNSAEEAIHGLLLLLNKVDAD